MFFHISSRTETVRGPVVSFTCPKCRGAVSGEVVETVERGKLYGVVPLVTLRNTFVTCGGCNRKLGMAVPLAKLEALPAEARGLMVLAGPPKMAMVLAVVGVLLILVPVVGMVVSGISLWLGRGNAGWVRALGWLGVIVNIAVTACVVMLMVVR